MSEQCGYCNRFKPAKYNIICQYCNTILCSNGCKTKHECVSKKSKPQKDTHPEFPMEEIMELLTEMLQDIRKDIHALNERLIFVEAKLI